jgi:hypothetical protein
MIVSDYLLPQIDYCIQLFKDPPAGMKDTAKLMNEHAKFLAEPTTMNMWFPCDEKGNIMKKPVYQAVGESVYDDKNSFDDDLIAYNIEKSKCIFELPDVPDNVDLIRYIDGIVMHCYSVADIVQANFKLKLKPHIAKKFYYVESI